MQPLEKTLRNQLERTVKDARDIAEDAAKASLDQLGVGESAPFAHLSETDRDLRRRLRIHGRQLGDTLNGGKIQTMDRLIDEVAYEHWHRMLFARFLAENNLLMYPDPMDPVPVTLEECEDLAIDEGAANGWELAARYAARMLPQIFRNDSPVFELTLPPEHQQKLEKRIADLPVAVFTASDSLGWVYQFWQAKRKDAVNASEVKIGARELPAVTQLFTEPYMVSFLLDNSLGAWWAARRLTEVDLKNVGSEEELRQKASIPGVPLEYLRFVKVEAASSRFKKEDEASSRLKEIGYLKKEDTLSILSGNLPHWRQESVTYFVTFRTADSIPQEKLKAWQVEKEAWLKQHPEPHDEKTKKEFYEKFPNRIQKWLDQGYGECLLKKPEYKTIVENAIAHFDGERYDLDEFVVMPNHVHAVLTPKNSHELSTIIHSWKSFTATQINKREKRSGAFWQKESFDHIVRNPEQLKRIRDYIRNHSVYMESGSGFQPFEKKRQDAASTVWTPAAGTFDPWPDQLSQLKILDPCCGSGHFIVAVFQMLVPMRMEMEGLTAREAVDAVLRENIHGLEIDKRCVELAAFALALAAWKYPDAGGYRVLPELNIACSGLSVSVSRTEWEKLAGDDGKLRTALVGLYEEFKNAPVLGSLIDPVRTAVAKLVAWDGLADAVEKALKKNSRDEAREAGVVAHGLARAARILAGRYQWVITNVPYLARGKQSEALRNFCGKNYPEAKNDLATVFLDRCLELCGKVEAASSRFHTGTVSVVLPQNWLFLTSYKKFREKLLTNDTWHLIARLGPQAFQTPMWDFNVQLITLSRGRVEAASSRLQSRRGFQSLDKKRQDAASTLIRGLDVSEPRTAEEKAAGLLTGEIKSVAQARQLENPDNAIILSESSEHSLLKDSADGLAGILNGDSPRFQRQFWEFDVKGEYFVYQQGTVIETIHFGGLDKVIEYDDENGHIRLPADFRRERLHDSDQRGNSAWGKWGVAISEMRVLPSALYIGNKFDSNIGVVLPKKADTLSALWCYCSDSSYNDDVRLIDQKLNVTNATLVKVPFDLDHWTRVAAEKYPNGLPKPYTDDPTQWIFHGHPCGSVVWDEEKKQLEIASTLRTDATVLQIALTRLLGYRWPAELESRSGFQPLDKKRQDAASTLENKRQDGASTMELSDEQQEWVNRCDALLPYADEDGIVCIPPVRGEAGASDRLLNLLAAAYGDAWSGDILAALLKSADHAGKPLETWLRDKFFIQHCKLFHHRPFIWHIWDGLRDGFAALVNYHKLDHKLLETLIYTYLGDWISRQKQDIASHVDGAQEKLDAAETLKKKLELILEGESPYDIFVRWKPIDQQPMGWNPDLNDGVRLNIRPFMTVPDVGKRGAGVLRDKPNIHWKKDRGKDVPSAPWYHLGPQYGGNNGDRINDHHLTLAEKQQRSRESKET